MLKWKKVVTSGMLVGEYNHVIDSKGRCIVPVKFRDDLGYKVIVTKGLDKSLFVYSLTEWNKFEEKLKNLPLTNEKARSFVRFFVAGATLCDIDKSGRINIPVNLLDYAEINKSVVIIGMLTRVEIWNSDNWKDYSNIENNDFVNSMEELGI